MSRIGKQPVSLAGATVAIEDTRVVVTGSKGVLEVALLPGVLVAQNESALEVSAEAEEARKFQGLIRTLLDNAITGVTKGWEKQLELHGVGMRGAMQGSTLSLNLGFSHPVLITPPEGISFKVEKNVITVSGIDKQLVGEISAQIRRWRKPEPYKGKGIRYSGEFVRRKAGKTGKGGK
jgi:large subunit ribosomal protein L6